MRTRHPVYTPRAGLSLFELLIALALLAFIAVGLAASFGLGIRLFERSQQMAALSDELALRARLRTWLGAATSPSRLATFPIGFEGSAQAFSFVTLAPTPFAPDAAALNVTVSLKGDDLRLDAVTIDDEGGELATHSGLLASGAAGVSMSYFAAQGDTPGWRDRWGDEARLPDLVRVELPDGSSPNWPEFTVRLLMAQ